MSESPQESSQNSTHEPNHALGEFGLWDYGLPSLVEPIAQVETRQNAHDRDPNLGLRHVPPGAYSAAVPKCCGQRLEGVKLGFQLVNIKESLGPECFWFGVAYRVV